MNEFGIAFLYLLGGVVFVLGGLITTWLLAPDRPNPEKQASYECGEEPVGSSWVRFNMRFYVLIFLIFDVEILLLFPWARVFADKALIAAAPAWGWFVTAEAMVFVVILLLGLAYVWVRGDIDWVRPKPLPASVPASVPAEQYARFNERAEAPQVAPPAAEA